MTDMLFRPGGDHYIYTHPNRRHLQFMYDLRPTITKIVGSEFPDVEIIANETDATPFSLQDWRDVALSEQHNDLWRDPVGTGIRHANEMVQHAEEARFEAIRRGISFPDARNVFLEGINEPVIETFGRAGDGSNFDEWLAMYRERAAMLDDYMYHFGKTVNDMSQYRAMLGLFSDGQPANNTLDGYAVFKYWFPKTTAFLEATADRNALGVHEYWRAEGGPEAYVDWHTCRWLHLDVECPIYVVECGVEQKITDDPYEYRPGWIDYLTPAEIADQFRRYVVMCLVDKRFGGAMFFTDDGAENWKSYYIESAYPEFLAVADALQIEIDIELPDLPFAMLIPFAGVDVPASMIDSMHEPVQPVEPVDPYIVQYHELDPLAMLTVIHVESAGDGFGPDGAQKIRFEGFEFKQRLGNDELFDQHFRLEYPEPWLKPQYYLNDSTGQWELIHRNQHSNTQALTLAESLNRPAAYESTSVGAGQVMGFNYKRLGYTSAEQMYRSFADENMQIIGMFNYVLSSPELIQAINDKNWRRIAELYNGNAVDIYAPRLAKKYAELKEKFSM
jgi:hypothetical protein